MIHLISSHIYVLIFKTCPCTTHLYILLVICQNLLNIEFLGSFRNCRGSFHRTCLTSSPDMSGSQVSAYIKGTAYPLEL
jgi:hypothetical protein